jgi:hypothetical protein
MNRSAATINVQSRFPVKALTAKATVLSPACVTTKTGARRRNAELLLIFLRLE